MYNYINKTLGRIVGENLQAAKVFEACDIEFCCHGNITVEEACKQNELDLEKVIEELYKADNNKPEEQANFFEVSFDFLTKYIVRVHHGYLYKKLPVIKESLQQAAKFQSIKYPELNKALNEYYEFEDIFRPHLKLEENEFFPYVRALEKHKAGLLELPENYRLSIHQYIREIEEDHQNAYSLLNMLKETCWNYELPGDACEQLKDFVAGMAEMAIDGHIHITLEDNVLHPRAAELAGQLSVE